MATAGWYSDYPYCELTVNVTSTNRRAGSVVVNFNITGRVNGYFLSPNYGGTAYVGGWSATWIGSSTAYGDSSGNWRTVYTGSGSTTINVADSATSASVSFGSRCSNSAWTSLNFGGSLSVSFAAWNPTVGVSGISVSPTSAIVDVGGSRSLSATISPSNATNKNVTWSSNNTTVATVSGGTVTGKSAGTCTITATAAGNNSKSATCSITVINNAGPNGSINATADPTWSNEQAVRVDHQSKYGLTVGGTYMTNITVGGTAMEKVTVNGSKVWFKTGNRTSAISCNNFTRTGNTSTNTSGGCASIDHGSNLFSSNRANPICPKQLTMSYVMNTLRTQTVARTARVRLFGRNSNGNWVEISLSNNAWTLAANSAASSGSLTITANTKNFFTNFKIGIYPDDKSYFITTCTLTNIRITSYDVDESLE